MSNTENRELTAAELDMVAGGTLFDTFSNRRLHGAFVRKSSNGTQRLSNRGFLYIRMSTGMLDIT